MVTRELIQPTIIETMRFRSAVPTTYRDIAETYPDLVSIQRAAEIALRRETLNVPVNYLLPCRRLWRVLPNRLLPQWKPGTNFAAAVRSGPDRSGHLATEQHGDAVTVIAAVLDQSPRTLRGHVRQ
jgi:hypothetical protein